MTELSGVLIGFILTLFIYSYLFGDNPLYRLAVHLLVGVSAAYTAIFIVQQVLLPIYAQIQLDPSAPDSLLWLVPMVMALLLIIKRLPIAWLGNIPIAYLIGVGAAIGLAGAVQGTLFPQILSSGRATPAWGGLVTALFTAVTLLSFQFTSAKKQTKGKAVTAGMDAEWTPSKWRQTVQFIGQILLTITFGAVFTAVLTSSITLFIERITYFVGQAGGM